MYTIHCIAILNENILFNSFFLIKFLITVGKMYETSPSSTCNQTIWSNWYCFSSISNYGTWRRRRSVSNRILFLFNIETNFSYDYIMKHESGLEEPRAKTFFAQMVNALAYCHNNYVVHRDLKPENMGMFFIQFQLYSVIILASKWKKRKK